MKPAEILEQATEADLGVAVQSTDPGRLRQALYRELRKLELNKHFALCVVDDEVFVVRRANLEELKDG